MKFPDGIKNQEEINKEKISVRNFLQGKIDEINLEIGNRDKLSNENEENINSLQIDLQKENQEKLEFQAILQNLLKNIDKINYKNSIVINSFNIILG